MSKRIFNHITLVIFILFMAIFGVSCGDGLVTKCSQLDGSYWKSCSVIKDSLYKAKVIRFENNRIYSGQTGNYMAYKGKETVGFVENIASFKIVDKGKLSMSVMTHHIPFQQISEEEFNAILKESQKN